ncbi:hypothetical protein [Jatrophihabitans fulvus]
MTVRRTLTVAALGVGLLAPFAVSATASASGRDVVRSSGRCSVAGTWELKAKHDDGRIEVEFEVDTNRAGQAFRVYVSDNGTLVAQRRATTAAPSGSFTVETRPANRAGTDVIRARAIRGENVCVGSVRV